MLNINCFLQQYSNVYTDTFFKIISFLITDIPLVVVLSYIYWCINKNKAFKSGIILLNSMQINFILKDIFRIERPYVKDERIINKDVKYGYGYSFPSNHSQMASTIFFSIKKYFNIKKNHIYGYIFIILVALSRMVLGVHSIADVATGLVMGYISVKLFSIVADRAVDGKKYYLLYVLIIFGIISSFLFKDKDGFKILLLYFGFITGYIVETKYTGYEIPKKLSAKIINYVIGITGVAIIYIFIESAFKYLIIGIWITLVAPYIFNLINRKGTSE